MGWTMRRWDYNGQSLAWLLTTAGHDAPKPLICHDIDPTPPTPRYTHGGFAQNFGDFLYDH